MKKFMKLALGAGLFLLDQSDHAKKTIQERVGDRVDDLRDLAQDTYHAAASRVARASKALRTDADSRPIWDVLRFAVGLGIGIGVGFLVAPAKGDETRSKLAGKAHELGSNVRHRFASHNLRATGTGD